MKTNRKSTQNQPLIASALLATAFGVTGAHTRHSTARQRPADRAADPVPHAPLALPTSGWWHRFVAAIHR